MIVVVRHMLHCLHKNVRAEQLLSTCVMKRSNVTESISTKTVQAVWQILQSVNIIIKKGVIKIDLWCLESCLIDCKKCGLHCYCKYCNVHFFLFCLLKVKIWFQNKRSKYKKIMKHGSSGPEGELLHTTSSSSPCSPGLSQLWEVSVANKVPPMHPSSYMNNYGHWYPPHHQDPVPRPQMMWLKSETQSQRDSIPCWHLPNLWRFFPLRCSYVFYCLVRLKGLCFIPRLPYYA